MQTRAFEAVVQNVQDTAVIHLHGEINHTAEANLLQACETAVSSGAARISLDFSDVNYINSTGIALIVQLLAEARKAKRRVTGYGLSSHYVEIFRITRLSDFIDLIPDPNTGSDRPIAS